MSTAATLFIELAAAAIALWTGYWRIAGMFGALVGAALLRRMYPPWAVQCLIWWCPIFACSLVAHASPLSVAGLGIAATVAASTLPDGAATDVHVHVIVAMGSFALIVAHAASDRWRARARWEQWSAWILAGAGLLAALPAATGAWGNVRYANVGACVGIAAVCWMQPRKERIRRCFEGVTVPTDRKPNS